MIMKFKTSKNYVYYLSKIRDEFHLSKFDKQGKRKWDFVFMDKREALEFFNGLGKRGDV